MALFTPLTNTVKGHLLFSMYLKDSLPPVTVECAGIIRLYVFFFFFFGIYMYGFQIKLLPQLQAKSFFSLSHSSYHFFSSGILILS